MRAFVKRLLAIASKEVLHLARDVRALYLALGIPLVMLLLYGYGISFDIDELRLAVIDEDRTPASRTLVRAFDGTNLFRTRLFLRDVREVEPLFRAREVQAALIIRAGFERALHRGQGADAQLLVDAADNTTGQVAVGYAAGVARSETERGLMRAAGVRQLEPPIEPKVRVYFNPAMKSSRFLVPGLIGIVVATLCTLLTALTVAREWERGSMEQLFATPVGRAEVILGKLIPYVGVGFVQVLLLLTLGTWLFDVPILGSIALISLLSLVFVACMLAQGLLLSVLAKNQQVAAQAGMVSTMLPALLLSGFMFPIDNMPPFLQIVSTIVPARHFIEALRSVMLKGGSFADVAHLVGALALIAVVLTTIATLRFQRRIA
jgi:ABC-2 type transport system permease protein